MIFPFSFSSFIIPYADLNHFLKSLKLLSAILKKAENYSKIETVT
ncbi:hypothetical protein PHG01_01357 [Streptococcus mutans PKUSS-HG01]|nr:hypothetical protein PHG01_01357 [Streptococcus mutans PKUSS-HG01]